MYFVVVFMGVFKGRFGGGFYGCECGEMYKKYI